MAVLAGPFAGEPEAYEEALQIAEDGNATVFLVRLIDDPGQPWEIRDTQPLDRPFVAVVPQEG